MATSEPKKSKAGGGSEMDTNSEWIRKCEESESVGQALRATLKIGDELVIEHFGAVRKLTVAKITKGRVGFEWTALSSGITRVLWLNDKALGFKVRDRREVK
jgi:hypothetical protein